MPAKILVTGGCGYIGSALVASLMRNPDVESVVVADSLIRGRLESIGYLKALYPSKLSFFRCDLRRPQQVADLFAHHGVPDAVAHLAATVDAATSLDEDRRILCEEVNHLATVRFARECADAGVRRFVSHSSTSVYGTGGTDLLTESSEPHPVTPYGSTKLASESLLELRGENGFEPVVLRPASVFGWAPGYRYEVAVNLLALYAHFGVPLTVYRTAEDELRPYLAIEDAVTALELSLVRPEVVGGLFNVVTFNAPLRSVVECITDLYPNVEKRYTEAPLVNQLTFAVSGERFKAATGFIPSGDLAKALAIVKMHLDRLSEQAEEWYRG
jgi:nucleoside-diphosphate-sugar epimerase